MHDPLTSSALFNVNVCAFVDVIENYKRAIAISPALNPAERDSLSVAYKDGFRMKRAAWRIVSVIEDRERTRLASQATAATTQQQPQVNGVDGGDKLPPNGQLQAPVLPSSPFLADIQQYRRVIEGEIEAICQEVVTLIDSYLLPAVPASDDESRIFYLKLYTPNPNNTIVHTLLFHCRKADYQRYNAEFLEETGEKRRAIADAADATYREASDLAAARLSPTLPIRLGLALNYSVFYHEIQNDASKACALAKEAFDAALKEIDSLSDETYRESTNIMQLLRDNLNMWRFESGMQVPGVTTADVNATAAVARSEAAAQQQQQQQQKSANSSTASEESKVAAK